MKVNKTASIFYGEAEHFLYLLFTGDNVVPRKNRIDGKIPIRMEENTSGGGKFSLPLT